MQLGEVSIRAVVAADCIWYAGLCGTHGIDSLGQYGLDDARNSLGNKD